MNLIGVYPKDVNCDHTVSILAPNSTQLGAKATQKVAQKNQTVKNWPNLASLTSQYVRVESQLPSNCFGRTRSVFC